MTKKMEKLWLIIKLCWKNKLNNSNHYLIHAVVIPGVKFIDDVCISTVCVRDIGISEVEKFKDSSGFETPGLGVSELSTGQRLIVRKNILTI